ncbi:MAG: hypothetical protein WD876_01655, partial [Candidatus Pacearchaeota archaeon]
MTKTLRNIVAGIVMGVVGLTGCHNGDNNKPNSNYATVITTDSTGKKTVEKFEDRNNDGTVDSYIIGKPFIGDGTVDNTMPNPKDRTT